MRESDIEKYLKKQIEELDGLCLKWVCPGQSGVPDRIIILPKGKVIFVELKNGKQGRLSALQRRMQAVLKRLQMRTYVLSTKTEIDELITELRDELD